MDDNKSKALAAALSQIDWLVGALADPAGQARGVAHGQSKEKRTHRNVGPDCQWRSGAGGGYACGDSRSSAVQQLGAGHH